MSRTDRAPTLIVDIVLVRALGLHMGAYGRLRARVDDRSDDSRGDLGHHHQQHRHPRPDETSSWSGALHRVPLQRVPYRALGVDSSFAVR